MEKYNLLPADEIEVGGTARPPSRTRSFWARQSGVAVASLTCNILFGLTVASLWWASLFGPPYGVSCYLPSDTLWGRKIPWKYVKLERDDAFVDSDPFDGRWNEDPDYKPYRPKGAGVWGPWDEIYGGSWVTVESPERAGLEGGTEMAQEGSGLDPLGWTPNDKVFGIAVMHQIHCVGLIKHIVNDYRRQPNSSLVKDVPGHTDHCFELLRQAIMCHGDMTLTIPNMTPEPGSSFTGTTGFGNTYLCRDWDAVKSAVHDHAVHYSEEEKGWRHSNMDGKKRRH